MITPRQRFKKVYETLTPEKRPGTDQAQRCDGLPAPQAQTRIYIYIYSVWASVTGSPKAQERGLHGSQYRPISALTSPPPLPSLPLPSLPRPPGGSRPARDAWQPAHCHDLEAATTWEPARYAKIQRKITAVLHDRRAPPCYKTDISKM